MNHYNSSMRAHKLMFETMHFLLLVPFIKTLATDMQGQFCNFIKHMSKDYTSPLFLNLCWEPELGDVIALYEEFRGHQSDNESNVYLMFILH